MLWLSASWASLLIDLLSLSGNEESAADEFRNKTNKNKTIAKMQIFLEEMKNLHLLLLFDAAVDEEWSIGMISMSALINEGRVLSWGLILRFLHSATSSLYLRF